MRGASLKRIAALCRKEILHIVKDPRTLGIVFMLPTVQLVLFGYSFNMEIGEVPLAVIDRDRSSDSRRLIEGFAGSDLFVFVECGDSARDITGCFRERTARAALVVPHDFQRLLRRGRTAPVQLIVDAADPNAAQLVRNYVGRVIADFNEGRGGAASAGFESGAAAPFDTRTAILFNPNLESSYFFVPGIVAMIMVMICALLTSITIAREKETGTMEQILVSPVRPREIIIGKVLPYVLLAFLDGLVVLLLGILLFDIPFRGDIGLMIALSTVYLLTALSLGLMISTRARTQQVAIMLALTATLLPTLMLSGLMFPIDSMPRALRLVTRLVPARYYLLIIRGIMLKGSGFVHLWREAAPLVAMTVVLLAVSVRRFNARLEG